MFSELVFLPLELDVSVPDRTPGQFWFGLGVAVVIFALITIYLYRMQYDGLSERQKAVKAKLMGQKHNATPESIRYGSDVDFTSKRSEILQAFAAAADTDVAGPDYVTGRNALGELQVAFRESWRPVVEFLPAWTIRVLQVGVLIGVLGPIAVHTDALVAALQGSPSYPHLGVMAMDAWSLTVDVASAGRDTLAQFPYAGVVWGLTFGYGVLTAQWVYQHWYVTAPVLLLGVAAGYLLSNRVSEGVDTELSTSRVELSIQFTAAFVVVWLAGVIPAAVGRLAGFPTPGAVLGFLLAVVLTLTGTGYGCVLFWRVLRRAATTDWGRGDWDRVGVAYLLVRRVWHAFTIAVTPFVLVYLAVILVEGKLTTLADGVASASTEAQALVALTVLLTVGVVGWLVRDAWPDVKAAAVEHWARKKTKIVVFRRGVPLVTFAVIYILAYAFGRSIAVALLASLLGGVGAWALYELAMRAKYQVSMRSRDPLPPADIVIEAFPPLESPSKKDGEDEEGGDRAYYLGRVNGDVEVLGDTREDVTDAIIRVAEEISEDGEADPTLAEWRARLAFTFGIVEYDEAETKVGEKVRTSMVQPLRESNGIMERKEFDDEIEEYPVEVRERKKQEYDNDILRVGEEYVELLRDPWRKRRAT